MPKRPRQHEIDELAQRAFKNALPASWIVNTFEKDYCKDFFVEVVENEDVKGDVFVVQLKGKQNPKVRKRDSTISIPIERDHLRYYFEDLPLPVFIVAVDVGRDKAYFDFSQRRIANTPKLRADLHSDGKVTFHLPLVNDLKDTALLLREVRTAWEYMRNKYPGSVATAASYRARALTELDPRFNFEINLVDGKEHIKVTAKNEPVTIHLCIKGSKKSDGELRRFFSEGTPIHASDDIAIEMTGSPVFERDDISSISFTPHLPVEVRIFAEDVAGQRTTFPDFRGHLTGGTDVLRFEGTLPDCPIAISFELRKPEGELGKAPMKFRWEPRVWVGRQLASVPWLGPVDQLVRCMARDNSQFGMSISARGAQFMETKAPVEPVFPGIRHFAAFCDMLVEASRIAKTLKLRVSVPNDWTEEDTHDIEELSNLIKHGRFTYPGTFNFTSTMSRIPEQLASAMRSRKDATFSLRDPSATYKFLGEIFDFGDAYWHMANWSEATVTDVDLDGVVHSEVELRGCTKTVIWPRFETGNRIEA